VVRFTRDLFWDVNFKCSLISRLTNVNENQIVMRMKNFDTFESLVPVKQLVRLMTHLPSFSASTKSK
jgi:hypothetical protein